MLLERARDRPHARRPGYKEDDIDSAIALHGPDLQRCIEFCSHPHRPVDSSARAATEEDWPITVMQRLGFGTTTITQALESCDFSFSKALTFLLLGSDSAKVKAVSAMQFCRHSAKRVFGSSADVLGSTSARCSYEARARRDLGTTVRAIDLGQYAGRTSGACFGYLWRLVLHMLVGSLRRHSRRCQSEPKLPFF